MDFSVLELEVQSGQVDDRFEVGPTSRIIFWLRRRSVRTLEKGFDSG